MDEKTKTTLYKILTQSYILDFISHFIPPQRLVEKMKNFILDSLFELSSAEWKKIFHHLTWWEGILQLFRFLSACVNWIKSVKYVWRDFEISSKKFHFVSFFPLHKIFLSAEYLKSFPSSFFGRFWLPSVSVYGASSVGDGEEKSWKAKKWKFLSKTNKLKTTDDVGTFEITCTLRWGRRQKKII